MMPGEWLPPGALAAVTFTIDDVHPGRSTDPYEAGGDLGDGVLGHLEWLLERHPRLRVTLFVTPDWREISPFPTRRIRSRLPIVRDRARLAPVHRAGTMQLDRHRSFCEYIGALPRVEIALHGLHHVHRGRSIPVEFQEQDRAECRAMLQRAIEIVESAGLQLARGMTPPGWNAPPALLDAMEDVGLRFVASARDITTPPLPDALAAGSGMRDVSLLHPQLVHDGRLVHIPTNFQATNDRRRAHDIVGSGGLLSIKAHAIKDCYGHVALDALDALYRNYLDTLLCELEDAHGDDLWWAGMADIAARVPVDPPVGAARDA